MCDLYICADSNLWRYSAAPTYEMITTNARGSISYPTDDFGTKLWKDFMRVMITFAPGAKLDISSYGRWQESKD